MAQIQVDTTGSEDPEKCKLKWQPGAYKWNIIAASLHPNLCLKRWLIETLIPR
jgi:hypothetical protein